MNDILLLILWLLALAVLFKLGLWIYKRVFLLVKLYSLKKECGAKITLHTFPLLPALCKRSRPDITVEILDTVYYIRLYSGVNSSKTVHFANERFSVIFSKLHIMMRASGRAAARRAGPTLTASFNTGGRVRVMKPLEIPKTPKRAVKVMMFSPAPNEVSYVTDEKTSIRLAFTGDELYGYKVFTASTFAIYAEREARQARDAAGKQAASPWGADN